jgi:hemoglobin
MQLKLPEIRDEAQRAAIEVAISNCVRLFYTKGLDDRLLGPVFGAIHDLPAHLEIIQNFWSRSLLGTERYQGHPYSVHTSLPIEPEHFQRWLELFTGSARKHFQVPRPNRRWPRRVIWLSVSRQECFHSPAPTGSRLVYRLTESLPNRRAPPRLPEMTREPAQPLFTQQRASHRMI